MQLDTMNPGDRKKKDTMNPKLVFIISCFRNSTTAATTTTKLHRKVIKKKEMWDVESVLSKV